MSDELPWEHAKRVAKMLSPTPKHPPGQTALFVAFGVACVGGVFGTIAGMETLAVQRCASWTALVFALPVYLYLKAQERAYYRTVKSENATLSSGP